MFILDCDIASTFAKIDRVGLLNKTFSSDVHITNSVHIELMRAKDMGFSFPERIFSGISTITLNDSELSDFQKFSQDGNIHFGEAEGISICKNRDAVFLTNDTTVVKFCEVEGIKVLNLKDVLIFIAKKDLVSKNEMINILKDIEAKDNTLIKNQEDILEEYEF
jgi:predicted nucleic acid-binding protein